MLKLWSDKPITDRNVLYVDTYFLSVVKHDWFNPDVIKCIEQIDGNKYIGNGISDSPVFGPIGPEHLSGGVKTLMFAIHNPNTVCPLEWLGDNCADMLQELSEKYDMTFTCSGYFFEFNPNQKIFCMEKNIVVTGLQEYMDYVYSNDFDVDFYKGLKVVPLS